MVQYSGRTSAYEHKRNDWQEHKGPFKPAVSQITVFNAQWTDCPIEVEEEVKRLWADNELHNDNCYYSWSTDDPENDSGDEFSDAHKYPIIAEYLESKGIKTCLIHWWW